MREMAQKRGSYQGLFLAAFAGASNEVGKKRANRFQSPAPQDNHSTFLESKGWRPCALSQHRSTNRGPGRTDPARSDRVPTEDRTVVSRE